MFILAIVLLLIGLIAFGLIPTLVIGAGSIMVWREISKRGPPALGALGGKPTA